MQEIEQMGIRGQDIPIELRQLPQQLPTLLQPLVDLLQSQPMSDALNYHNAFLSHIHSSPANSAPEASQASTPHEDASQDGRSASHQKFALLPALHQMRSLATAALPDGTGEPKSAHQSPDADTGSTPQDHKFAREALADTASQLQQPLHAGEAASNQQVSDPAGGETLPGTSDATGEAEIDWSAAMEMDAEAVADDGGEAGGLQGDIDWDIDLAGVEVLEDDSDAHPDSSGESSPAMHARNRLASVCPSVRSSRDHLLVLGSVLSCMLSSDTQRMHACAPEALDFQALPSSFDGFKLQEEIVVSCQWKV